ncbi:phage integrase Arm DNA-binding domain-containing protein [Ferrimonas aestuarii]|uniref:Integrase n=1 Tax=Ferrimonas aestuarii TaxID=2569539 RepID=A0A4U1BNE0_9GAMM|nr:phage integrase Arm DNA-binding domain-containing protein [Ferrimonas aestuarii]TKB53272.1 integrase [Ferrimonas aestuarii]
MAARPRTHKITIDNLYQKLDKRTGKTYYQYRDQRTGKFHGLGTDKKRAQIVAAELNRRIAAEMVEQYARILDANPTKTRQRGISTGAFCKTYMTIQQERMDHGEIVKSTVVARKSAIGVLAKRCKSIGLKELDTKTLAIILDEYKRDGKVRMAQSLRSVWIDMFKEAQHLGEVDPGYNPAAATKAPRVTVTRERLTEKSWMAIISKAEEHCTPNALNAMLIGLTTGLRRVDISQLKFKDVQDGYLLVATNKSKGKTKLGFSLALTNPLVGISLGEIIKRCRNSGVVSQYIIHDVKQVSRSKAGSKVDGDRLSKQFKIARDATGLKWDGTPPTFHEIRSLAERTYADAGYDTQKLLGHKNRQTTDKYHDQRGSEYLLIDAG